MSKSHKILISVLSFIFSLLAACIGVSLVNSSDMTFGIRFLYDFIFMMQAISTIWVLIALHRKK